MGAYDDEEHERRESKTNHVDAAFDDDRAEYSGSVRHEGDESAAELLDQFERING